MTVQNSNVKNIYIGNGSTTSFPFTFPCPKTEYIKVFVRKNNLIAQTDDFTVDLDNATVTYPKSGTPLAAGENLVILRELPLEQPLNLVNQGPFFAEDIETTLDEEVMMIQQLREQLGRSLTVPVDIDGENAFETSVPIKPGMSFRVKDDGSGFEETDDPARVLPLASDALKKAEAARDVAIAKADAAGASAVSAAESETAADRSATQAEEAKTAAEASETAAAKSAAAAKVSEGNAKTSETNALTHEGNAKASADKAKASETNAADSASTASAKASVASASAAAAKASETAAATSASAANASKVAAKTSEDAAAKSAAASKTSETNAKASEGEAGFSASMAEGKANDARQSAELARDYANAAKASESKVTTSANEAEAAASQASASATDAQRAASQADTSAVQAGHAMSTATDKAEEASVSAANAKTSETAAKVSESKAKASETNAKTSETNAGKSATTATTKASEASVSATNAKASETAAKVSETNAKASEGKAKTSETNAGVSASTASQQATKATTEANRAKTEADRAKTAADSVGNPVVDVVQSGDSIKVTKGDGSSNSISLPSIDTSEYANLLTDNTFDGTNRFDGAIVNNGALFIRDINQGNIPIFTITKDRVGINLYRNTEIHEQLKLKKSVNEYISTTQLDSVATDVVELKVQDSSFISISPNFIWGTNDDNTIRICVLLVTGAGAPTIQWNCIPFCDAPTKEANKSTIVSFLAVGSNYYLVSFAQEVPPYDS